MSRKVWIVLGAIVLVIVVTVGSTIGTYNSLVGLNQQVDGSWAQVETVLQRRYDLIPNLVNTVQGFADQEQEVLTEVTRLRSQWGEAGSQQEQAQVAGQLEGALGRLMIVVERYPELRSNQNFLALQDELAGTENRIAVERRRFNESVQSYNTRVRQFPAVLIANMTGFGPREFFEAGAGADVAPEVEF
jgi:LemA protein